MRVYDAVQRAAVIDPVSADWKRLTQQAVVVEATNVAEWWKLHSVQVNGEDQLKLYDRVIPPFPVTLVEFTGVGEHWTGVVVFREPAIVGWNITVGLWITDLQQVVGLAAGFVTFTVSADGAPDWGTLTQWRLPGNTLPDDLVNNAIQDVMSGVAVALLTFRFMHAKNVQLIDKQAPRHERRQAQRAGLTAPTTYKVLEIRPITTALQTHGQVDHVGMAKAFHLCRGHFADYTKGAGLFGKYKVEVFVPEHVKGRKEKGVVVKDYRLPQDQLPPE